MGSGKMENNCQQRKNKYFVRDIYFISGIIYDFPTRNNFSVFFLSASPSPDRTIDIAAEQKE
jgi:hypothetical protein